MKDSQLFFSYTSFAPESIVFPNKTIGCIILAFSASALGFLLQGLNKPVIFTGSQLPISKVRSDAHENLVTAIEIAMAQNNGKPRVPEVAVFFDNNLYRGVRSTKNNASRY